MEQPWLTVVGTDDGGPSSLPERARAVVEAAEVLVGGARHHALFPGVRAERLTWRNPLEASLDEIARRRGRRVVVLASGDPMCFGIGTTLSQHFSPEEMRIWPAPSSAALVRARLRWPADEVELLSLHAAPPARLRRHLWPGAKLVVLSRDETTPGLVGQMLSETGFGASRVWVLEHLGGPDERIVETAVATLGEVRVARLNVVAIACRSEPGTPLLPAVPGLPDGAFASDGLLTRREIRAITLARLQPGPGQRLIDVGAGSGSVAIEWLRAARHGHAVA
ncbi:MAG TPA: precorrin-6y C5,15-methyltransferase (decarboxylating) subunit CbiE, partial [Geminicoccaceae bacterium]